MSASDLTDLSRCAVHTFTNKPWSLRQCIEAYAAAGIPAVSVWRNVIDPAQGGVTPAEGAKMLADAGLKVPALVRGGFFPAHGRADRDKAVDENRRCLDEAMAIGAEMLVLVVGAVPGLELAEARQHVTDGIAACLEHAEDSGVKLAIEPLHPMYAADKSCINRMAEARAVCEQLNHPKLGIAVDVYHTWWDPDLEQEIRTAGDNGWLLAFHVCDWRVHTRDLLTDRGLMGDGCIDVPTIRGWVEAAGFQGFNEVEVFSEEYWAWDQHNYLDRIVQAYLNNT
ncbi:MAG: sugar phosphate isomerase/epimerase family protein [Phycisphaeraceae bacterium]